MSILAYCAIVWAIIATVLYVRQCIRSIKLAKAGLRCAEDAKDAYEQIENFRDHAAECIKTCKLIDIKRNGKINYFTFARGSNIFIIETMGLMADVPNEWRKQAGLD